MDKVLVILALWCTPSAVLAVFLTWRSHRSQARLIKIFHLEDLFTQRRGFV